MQLLSYYTRHRDERGELLGLTRDTWEEANIVETVAGAVRGGHYHAKTRELFYILDGSVQIHLADVRSGQSEELTVTQGALFIIEPFIRHIFTCLERTRWINMLSRRLQDETPDFYR
jgi:dTDP-4-dehydrorhamnose 3,5-epimerase-like enzyme